MDVKVVRAGMLTTVQDLGRFGHRGAGVPVSGAMDNFAFRAANLLVGNPDNAPALEFTLAGPELVFARDTLIAASGADFGIARWQPITVRAGEPVRFVGARSGCRGYVAIPGGFKVPLVLGSASTFLRGGFGGWNGRVLRDGDVLETAWLPRQTTGQWRLDERMLPPYSASPELRVVRGAHAEQFPGGIAHVEFKVSPKSDRMGVRLVGVGVARDNDEEIRSTAVVPGTVQVPPDGQPIILMADAQTLGGYPQIAHVISVDLPLVAQLCPGDSVRFREVTLAEAHELALAREGGFAILRQGLARKFS